MFIGHFAVGFAAKKFNPKPSLGTYFLAAQLLDLLWPTFLLLNMEHAEISNNPSNPIPLSFTHYPISHSLLAVAVWAILFSVVYTVTKKNYKAALLLGFCVISHWLLDLIVHIPDLPLYPGDAPLLGLGLWKSKLETLILELSFFAVSILLYLKSTIAKNKTGFYSTWGLIVFLIIVHLVNVFGSAPPNMTAVAWMGQLQWLIVIWAYWCDRNRQSRNKEAAYKEAASSTSATLLAS
jgi:FtsH-binding integral membrane protein